MPLPVLPTPIEHDGSSNGASAASRQGGPSLLDQLHLLPTPQARDGVPRGAADPARRRARGRQVSLHDAVHPIAPSPATLPPTLLPALVPTLLPTPTAINPNDSEDPTHWLARRERHRARAINGNGMGMPLSIAVRLLPTPTASDAKNCTHRTQRGGPSLPDQARLLPTPRASDTGTAGRRAGAGFRPPLSQQVLPLVTSQPDTESAARPQVLSGTASRSGVLLPTPRATDGTKGCPAQRGSKGDLMLPSAVIRLMTDPLTDPKGNQAGEVIS